MDKPSLNQVSALIRALESQPDHFGIFDFSKAFNKLSEISVNRYRYIYALLFNKKYFQLKQVLDQIGIEHK